MTSPTKPSEHCGGVACRADRYEDGPIGDLCPCHCTTCRPPSPAKPAGAETGTHPVQKPHRHAGPAECPKTITMKAYEVYCALYGEQEALVTGSCRGGFSTGELIAFLYAATFPREQWRSRTDEAFRGMKNL